MDVGLDPVVEDGCRPRAVWVLAGVELLHEDGENPPALCRVGDGRGRSRQVGDDAVFEVEGELRSGGEVLLRRTLRTRQTRLHSPFAFASPRIETARKPSTCLIHP